MSIVGYCSLTGVESLPKVVKQATKLGPSHSQYQSNNAIKKGVFFFFVTFNLRAASPSNL